MIKQGVRRLLRRFGYEFVRTAVSSPLASSGGRGPGPSSEPPPADAVWPLPRRSDGLSSEDIQKKFGKFELWHYAYEFEGGLSFSTRHNHPGANTDAPRRPLQRFRHFMPHLVESQGGSLKGKRVLDIACNSGFWSLQCALLGAEVVGFDARPELIEQANLLKSIIGLDNVDFRVLDFWDMSPEALDGTFDVVLNLGILYHLPDPLEVLKLTRAMAGKNILLDTGVHPSVDPVIKLAWEEPLDIRSASSAGMVAYPSKSGIDLMLRHLGVAEWFEVPIRTGDMPRDYLENKRASWLISI